MIDSPLNVAAAQSIGDVCLWKEGCIILMSVRVSVCVYERTTQFLCAHRDRVEQVLI